MRRLALLDRLRKGGSFPVLSVVAPAGYGKTTLLSQWAERNGQAFAWVSLDERDNDPKVLLTYVAEALDAVELRLLPMLATHLSFPQIAEQMSLSRHTVKAEVTSIYRKLGASSRDQAVMRARDLGLLDR